MATKYPTRRQFIECTGCVMALMACGQPLKGSSSKDSGPLGDTGTEEAVFDPCVTVADPSWESLSFDSLPNLHEVGGSTVVSVGGRSILVAQVSDNCFIGVDSACTHEGETLNYQTIGNRITCPRHAATFGLDGRVIAGPTPVPLQSYPVALDGDLLYIQIL